MRHPTAGRLQRLLHRFERLPTTRGPIALLDTPTVDTLDAEGYLLANPDLAAAAQASPDPDFAARHFQDAGHNEHRQQFMTGALPQVAAMRKTKLAKLRKRSPRAMAALETHRELFCGRRIGALKVPGDPRLPVPYERISCNLYAPEVDTWIDEHPGWLFLDAGAGFRNVYRPNVVNAEIAMFPSTDVLCFGDSLPFDDDTFDGVLSFAVLEHVEDPFRVTEELVRVVKPGGRIIVDWPFLQPLHGYPHHYFNATPEGARLAFERIDGAKVVESFVPLNLHPVFSLRWILDEWQAGMSGEDRDAFLQLTVSDILDVFAGSPLNNPWTLPGLENSWVTGLPQSGQAGISAGTRVIVTKT